MGWQKGFLWSAVKTSVLKTHSFGKKAKALEAGGEGEEFSGESSSRQRANQPDSEPTSQPAAASQLAS